MRVSVVLFALQTFGCASLLLAGCPSTPAPCAPTVVAMLPQAQASLPVGLPVPFQAQVLPCVAGAAVTLSAASDSAVLLTGSPDADGFVRGELTFPTEGPQTLVLTATEAGETAQDSVPLLVRGASLPTITLLSPLSSQLHFADRVALEATVDDAEHERPALRVAFEEDGVVLADLVPDAFGAVRAERPMTEGTHTIDAIVTDPDGQQALWQTTFDVLPANTRPSCAILDPPPTSERPAGVPLVFRAQIDDAETPQALTFTLSSQDGPLAEGAPDADGLVLDTLALPPGGHLLTLTADDGYGGTCTATAEVTLRDCDLDSDGSISTTCGGRDCADGDPAIHPFAGDTYGDDLDPDCDGYDCAAEATAAGVYLAACFPFLTHEESDAACVAAGYDGLASVRSTVEEQAALDLAAAFPGARLWVGLRDDGAGFAWSDGASTSYLPWLPGQPDLGAIPACAEITSFAGWSDLDCGLHYLNLGMLCQAR